MADPTHWCIIARDNSLRWYPWSFCAQNCEPYATKEAAERDTHTRDWRDTHCTEDQNYPPPVTMVVLASGLEATLALLNGGNNG